MKELSHSYGGWIIDGNPFQKFKQVECSFECNEFLNLDIQNHISVDDELPLIFESKEKDQATLEDLKGTLLVSKSPDTDLSKI